MPVPSIGSRNAEDAVVPAAQLSLHLADWDLMAAHHGLDQYPSRGQRWHSLLPLWSDRCEGLVFQCSWPEVVWCVKTHFCVQSAVYIYVDEERARFLRNSTSLANNPIRKVTGEAGPISQFFFFLFFKLFRIENVAEDTKPCAVSGSSLIGSRLGS